MPERSIPALLRRIVQSTIAAPLLLGSSACGSASSLTDVTDDGGAPTCSTPPPDDAALTPTNPPSAGPSCVQYTLPLQGDPGACGLYAPGTCWNPGMPTAPALCAALCHQDGGVFCSLGPSGQEVSCEMGCAYGCTGRRPMGLALDKASGRSAVGRWLAEAAAQEAASVEAFEILRAELLAHGAPRHLVSAARRAAADEVRHTRAMTSLALRHGGAPCAPRVRRPKLRSLEAIALENATEGCVRETYGAVVGLWQARFAKDPAVRRAMAGIAHDESRHASLSWQVARWIEGRLSPSARRNVKKARARAMMDLERDVSQTPASDIVREVGIPSPHHARVLLDRMREALLASSARSSEARERTTT